MIGKTYIELKLQNYSVKLTAKYLKSGCLINTLEIYSISCPADFQLLTEIDFNSHLISILSVQNDEKSLKFFEEFESKNNADIKERKKGLMIICDSPESKFNSIYLLFLGSDPLIANLGIGSKNFGMFCITTEEFALAKKEACLECINQLRGLKSQMENSIKKLIIEEEKINKSIAHSKDAIQYFEYENSRFKSRKKKVDSIIKKKFRKIEKIHKKIIAENDFYCGYCLNEFKNVMFMPCGHVEVCQSCLINNLKIELGDNFSEEKLCMSCQSRIEKSIAVSFS